MAQVWIYKTTRTIENYLKSHKAELTQNGYEILKGTRLKILKKSISSLDVPETDFGNIAKSPQLGVFGFRTFLNLAMVIVESQRARLLNGFSQELKSEYEKSGRKLSSFEVDKILKMIYIIQPLLTN